MLPLEIQLFMVAVMTIAGMAAGLLYDIFGVARRTFRWRGWAGELADLLLWTACAAVLVAGLVVGSWGAARTPILLAALLGAVLYHSLAQSMLQPVWRAVLGKVERAVRMAAGRLRSLPGRLQRLGKFPPRLTWPWRWPFARRP